MKNLDKVILVFLLLMGIYHASIGFIAFFMPAEFYEMTSYKGGFNQHYIQDVGAAYLTAGWMLVLAALLRSWRAPLTLAAGMFLSLHGLLHLYEATMGLTDSQHLLEEVFTVFVPTLIVLAIAFFSATQRGVDRG